MRCPELVTLPNNKNQLTALHHAGLYGDLTLPEGLQRIPFLRSLDIEQVEADSLPGWLGDMTSLQQLKIQHCPELRSLPSCFQHLTNLRELYIEDCPKLEKLCKRGTGEDWQTIAHIPQIDIISTAKQKVTFCEKIQLKCNRRKRKRGRYPRFCEFDDMVDSLLVKSMWTELLSAPVTGLPPLYQTLWILGQRWQCWHECLQLHLVIPI